MRSAVRSAIGDSAVVQAGAQAVSQSSARGGSLPMIYNNRHVERDCSSVIDNIVSETQMRAAVPVMRSKAETFAAYAVKCDRKAQAATNRRLKELFADLAFQWRDLAATTRLLEADQKERENFFRDRSISGQLSARVTILKT